MTAVATNIQLVLPQSITTEVLTFGTYYLLPHEENAFVIARAMASSNESNNIIPEFLSPDNSYGEKGRINVRFLKDCLLLFNTYEEATKRVYNIKKIRVYDHSEFIVYQVQSEHFGLRTTLRPVKIFPPNL